MLKLDPIPKVITFDCYGTLVQWHKALAEGIRTILVKHAKILEDVTDSHVKEIAAQFRTVSMETQAQHPYRDYKTVLQSSLAEIMSRQGLLDDPKDGETLLSFLRNIDPHPEVPAALRRLRAAGYRLAIISNTDDDLIAATVASIGVTIDFVITAEQAKAYKPDHQLFRHAYAVMGVAADETVHVGMGQFTDLKVCQELDIRVIWIDRVSETLDPQWKPDAVLPDLSELPELLKAR